MINQLKQILHKIKDYDRLKADIDNCNLTVSHLKQENLTQIEENFNLANKLVDLLPEKKDVNDADYWNKRWKQSIIFYAAPKRKKITEYLEDREIAEITAIAQELIDSEEDIRIIVMEWVNKQFKSGKWIYKVDKFETWSPPESSLIPKKGIPLDCDDVALIEYYIIREILQLQGLWETHNHRLKMVIGHVHEADSLKSYAGFHAYLIWLHDDGEFYTIESTFNRDRAIANFGKLPHKDNPQYGVIACTFTEYASFAQHKLDFSRSDIK